MDLLCCAQLFSFILLLSSTCYAAQPPYALAICAVFKNESFFLKQWIEFHTALGADHFYLYDNESTDDSLDILAPYIASGLVELISWPAATRDQKEYLTLLQLPAYNDALSRVQETARWAAFIDLDEFLCPMRHANLIDMLAEYEEYGALAVNWQVFGTSFIDRLEPGHRIIEDFIWKAPSCWEINKYIKVIVQPRAVHSFTHPHYCLFHPGFYLVNSDKVVLPLREVQPILIDTIRIHHYWFGDLNWFFQNKLPRRKQWGLEIPPDNLPHFIASFNQEQDLSMHRFLLK